MSEAMLVEFRGKGWVEGFCSDVVWSRKKKREMKRKEKERK
jgi:hypothetical protein